MEHGTLAAWVAAAVAFVALLLTVRNRKQDMDGKTFNERIRPLSDAVSRHDVFHSRHFEASQGHAIAMARLQKQMDDHEEQDRQRFASSEDMLKEIRDDIKQLLRRDR